MNPQSTSQQEQDDLIEREVLQSKLQAAIRRSAPPSEMRKIQDQIEELNRKLESYAVRVKRPPLPTE